jgi:hypothetical protein
MVRHGLKSDQPPNEDRMKTFEVPDLSISYVIGDHKITLDPIETDRKINEIARAREGCTDYEHLDDFKVWVKEKTGVEITAGHADFIIDSIRTEICREKKERMDSLLSLSRPTPDSIPPE